MTSKRHFSNYGITLLTVLVLALLSLAFVVQLVPQAHASVETDFMATLNAERATLGKNPLAINPSLSTAAYLHSKDMGDNNYFSHTSLDGTTFDKRIVTAGYTGWSSLGENIAYAYGSPDSAQVYSMWKNSAGHYANMMGDFNEAGLGVYSIRGYTYYTLDLGKRSNPLPPPAPTPTADFALSTSPSTLNVQAGSSGTATATVTSVNGFSGTIAFTVSAPTGWTVNVNPASVTISSGILTSATIAITVPSSVTAGTYGITLTGTSGSTKHSVTIMVYVSAAPTPAPDPSPISTPDFSISTPPTVNVNAASSVNLPVTIASLGGFNGFVSLRVMAPYGWTMNLDQPSLKLTSGSSTSATVSITVPASTVARTYTVVIIVTDNSLYHAIAITVNVQATQQVQAVPSAPQNLKATAGDSQVGLSWAAPSDNGGSTITNYKVYKRSATGETLLAIVGNVLSYTDTSVTNGQTYYYRIAGVNSFGESAKSNEASTTPSTPTTPAPQPSGTLSVVVTTDKPSYTGGATVIITVTVRDSITGNALQGASVSIQIYDPSGTLIGSVTIGTGSSGTVKAGPSFGWTVLKGAYTVRVTALQAGYQSKTEQTTFAII